MDKTIKIGGIEVKPPTYSVDMSNGDRKMKELILYISGKLMFNPGFTEKMLGQILWKIDSLHFKCYGTPVTGQPYVNEQ